MQVQIIATRACSHRPNLEHELSQLGVAYEVLYVEEQPNAVERFDIRHSPNLVIDGEVGLVVPPRNPDALVTALSRLAEDADLRQRLGSAARRRVVELFSTEKRIDKLEELYREVLE